MKIKILNALKTEYANLGLGDKAFNGVASFLEKTITDESEIVNRIKEDDVKAILAGIQGESDALRAARLKAERDLADYKREHPEDTTPPPPGDDANALILAELKAMREENKSIKEQIEAEKAKIQRDAIRDRVVSGLKNGQKNWDISVKDALRDVSFEDNDTEDTFLAKLKSAAADSYKEHYGEGAVPPAGIKFGTSDAQDDPDEFKAGLDMVDKALFPAKKD